MTNVTNTAKESRIPAFFRLGFRPLFLSAAIFSVIAVSLWGMALAGQLTFNPYGGSLWWHGHEMIFGFAAAVVVGFLLTAVQNWTSIPGIKGMRLAALYFIWFLGRILLLFRPDIPEYIIITVDLAFLPTAAILLAVPILKIKQYRNLVFVPVLLLLTLCNVLTYLQVLYPSEQWTQQGTFGAVMLIALLIVIVGGRVIPMFTANGTKTKKTLPIKWLELTAIISTALCAISFISGLFKSAEFLSTIITLFIISGLSNLIRWWRWRFWVTFKVPLVWSLHFSYIFIPLGFLLIALHYWQQTISLPTAMHGITVGAIGSIIVAMMARVSLGHTGRQLKTHWLMPSVFFSLVCAGIVRVMGSTILVNYYLESLMLSSLLWVYGFGVFVVIYFPVLTRSRIDGRPG